MEKQWQVAPVAPDSFFITQSRYSCLIAQLLYNRKLFSTEEVEAFFHPENVSEYDPFLFKDMSSAIDLVIEHIKKGSRITICGDYDADGVTSSALLAEVLSTLQAQVDVWIPSRFGEGYGLNPNIVKELAETGVNLLITVDNGIRAKNEVTLARSLGLDVIVTDHHEGPSDVSDLPPCLVINPILDFENYPFKYLCGAGVAYTFARALISKSTLSPDDKEKLKNKLVDLAAIGTISDCVTLFGENRLIVRNGLEQINHRPRRGLKELITVANLNTSELTAWNISWQITPRLNAAGRIDHANTAYKLFTTTSEEEAQMLADDLNQKNSERQRLTEEIMLASIEIIEKEQSEQKLLVVISPDLRVEGTGETWPEGVIGLVAGRLAEKFAKPCFVICQSEGHIKGSGRSIEQYDLGASLEIGKEYLERFGGHKMACGFTVKSQEDLEPFISVMRATAQEQLSNLDLSPVLRIEAVLSINDINPTLVEQIELFAPFGQDNPEPRFISFASTVEDVMMMGQDKKHIKFRFNGIWAIAFGRANILGTIKPGEKVDIVYTVGFNIFNNHRNIQLKIVDMRLTKDHE